MVNKLGLLIICFEKYFSKENINSKFQYSVILYSPATASQSFINLAARAPDLQNTPTHSPTSGFSMARTASSVATDSGRRRESGYFTWVSRSLCSRTSSRIFGSFVGAQIRHGHPLRIGGERKILEGAAQCLVGEQPPLKRRQPRQELECFRRHERSDNRRGSAQHPGLGAGFQSRGVVGNRSRRCADPVRKTLTLP